MPKVEKPIKQEALGNVFCHFYFMLLYVLDSKGIHTDKVYLLNEEVGKLAKGLLANGIEVKDFKPVCNLNLVSDGNRVIFKVKKEDFNKTMKQLSLATGVLSLDTVQYIDSIVTTSSCFRFVMDNIKS